MITEHTHTLADVSVTWIDDDVYRLSERESPNNIFITVQTMREILKICDSDTPPTPAPCAPKHPRQRRVFPSQFKRDALALARHMPLKQAANRMDISPKVLRGWRNKTSETSSASVTITIH